MRRWIAPALLAAILACAQLAPAGPSKDKKKAATGGNPSKKLVTGDRVEKKVAMLTTEVKWHSSLEEAKSQARAEQKAIFWLHALGDLEGDT